MTHFVSQITSIPASLFWPDGTPLVVPVFRFIRIFLQPFDHAELTKCVHFPQSDFQTSTSTSVWLAVNEDGICVLEYLTMQPSHRFAYDSIVTFGGCQDDFMMVVTMPPATVTESERGANRMRHRLSGESCGTLRILFRTKKPEVRRKIGLSNYDL